MRLDIRVLVEFPIQLPTRTSQLPAKWLRLLLITLTLRQNQNKHKNEVRAGTSIHSISKGTSIVSIALRIMPIGTYLVETKQVSSLPSRSNDEINWSLKRKKIKMLLDFFYPFVLIHQSAQTLNFDITTSISSSRCYFRSHQGFIFSSYRYD